MYLGLQLCGLLKYNATGIYRRSPQFPARLATMGVWYLNTHQIVGRKMTTISSARNHENTHGISMCGQRITHASRVVDSGPLVRKPASARSFRQFAIRSASNDRLKFYSGSHCKY